MHTEDEAKKKWSPHVRWMHYVRNDGAPMAMNNRASKNDFLEITPGCDPKNTCIGSACMAWRWAGPQVQEQLIDSKDYAAKDAAKAEGWRYEVSYDDGKDLFIKALSDAPNVGFCGLSGAPS